MRKGECIRERTPLSLDDAKRLIQLYVDHYCDFRLPDAIGYPQRRLGGISLGITEEERCQQTAHYFQRAASGWGRVATRTLKVDDKLVRTYADVSGDHNPVHVNDAFAARTRFGRRIAHGGILFGFVSKVIGNDLPGVGTIFREQTISFKAPVLIDETVTLVVTVAELLPKNGAKLTTVITNEKGLIVANGTAEVKLPLLSE
jgi:3-hydroxybutyryl-CoA dehydratase